MTNQDIEQIEARVSAATPGPWHADGVTIGAHESDGDEFTVAEVYDECVPNYGPCGTCGAETGARCSCGEPASPDDAVFIAAARTDIPNLIAALRAERAKLDAALATVETLSNRAERAEETIERMLVASGDAR